MLRLNKPDRTDANFLQIGWRESRTEHAKGTEPLILIEVQQGIYFGEDDIVALHEKFDPENAMAAERIDVTLPGRRGERGAVRRGDAGQRKPGSARAAASLPRGADRSRPRDDAATGGRGMSSAGPHQGTTAHTGLRAA